MALGADGFDRLLARALRQRGRFSLFLSLCERDECENGGGNQKGGRRSRHCHLPIAWFVSKPARESQPTRCRSATTRGPEKHASSLGHSSLRQLGVDVRAVDDDVLDEDAWVD